MTVRSLLTAILATAAGCSTLQPVTHDPSFHITSESFVASYFQERPGQGVALGWHQYDGQFVVPTTEVLAAEHRHLVAAKAQFDRFTPGTLQPEEAWDRELIRLQLEKDLWGLDVARSPWRNPMDYAGAIDIQIYLKRDFAPLSERVRSATRILTNAPAVFASARVNLEPNLPKPFVETAIEVAAGGASFLEHDGLSQVRTCTDAAAVSAFEEAASTAIKEFKEFASWLKTERLPHADNTSYAVGEKGFAAMLRNEHIDLPPADILKIGLAELKKEQQRFAEAARVVDPSRPPIEVFKSIQKDHPTAATLIPDSRQHLNDIRQYIVQQRLLTIPGTTTVRVEETPPPLRSTTFASMDTPGPFETKAAEAYYYITPAEPQWPVAQQEEWLTAFNYYTTDVVSIHEAYPGHYVQFLALNASGAGMVKKVFTSYAFAEGWAHYCEQMMLDAGFPAAAPGEAAAERTLRAAKYRLAQSDEALLRLCRLCCAVRLHCGGMTVDQAARFFEDNCYYEPKPARQEAVRGTFDPEYGFYTLGKLQILKLRHDCETQDGTAFDLQKFHDRLLSRGAPPLRLLRESLLTDPKTWGAIL